MSENLNIYERATYGHATPEEILEALAELVAWRNIGNVSNEYIESPEECENYIEDLEGQASQCNNEEHSDYDDLKEFLTIACTPCRKTGRALNRGI